MIVFRNTRISNAWLMSNSHLLLVIHVNPQLRIILIQIIEPIGNRLFLTMQWIQISWYIIIEHIPLSPIWVYPLIWFRVVRYYIVSSISKIFLSKFKWPLQFYFFHATILFLSVNITCWLIESLVCINIGKVLFDYMFCLPFILNIYYLFWPWT